MKLTTVESRMIRAIGYDRNTRLMEVVFNSGQTYCYEKVPPSEYTGLMKARSKGAYMQDNIIDTYPCYRLGSGKQVKT